MISNTRFSALTDSQLQRIRQSPKYISGLCPTCLGEGTFRFEGEDKECDCRTQIRLQQTYLAANIGPRYHTISFGDFFDGFLDLEEKVREYIEAFDDNAYYGRGITFAGPQGTGKTFAGILILKELLKRGHKGLFLAFSDLLDYQRRQWDDTSNRDFDEARETSILILDELFDAPPGKQREFLATTLERILRYRVNNNLPTIITTNISRQSEQMTYPRVFSLLSASQERMTLEGEDQRIKMVGSLTKELAKKGERRPIV